MHSKVFITQIPHKWNPEISALVPTMSIIPAEEFGKIIEIMPPAASRHSIDSIAPILKETLSEYDYDRGDSIISLGDPAIIALACAILGKYKDGKFKVLKWERATKRYFPVDICI